MLIAGCTRRPRAAGSFLSRPTIAADGRVAFVGGGRIWIADAVAVGRARHATALPLDWPADRPRWHGPEPGLAMSVWFEPWQADLAIWTGSALERLTSTPEDELLDDVSPAGALLFERGGWLWQAELERSGAGSARLAPEHQLTPGRDGCYSPDGKHVAFVRGHESDPLGIWRQGYAGGDDSEIFFLSLEWMSVLQLTDTPDNDECPVPLDDIGRRFIVCRERGGPYRPWIVEVITSKKHRVRRLPMPEGPWPILFPAIRRLGPSAPADTSLALELWAEADGGLIATQGAVERVKLAFPQAAPVKIDLDEHGLHAGTGLPAAEEEEEGGEEADAAGSAGRLPAEAARELSFALTRAIMASPLAAPRWEAIAPAERRRFLALLRQTWSERERTELIRRMLGRLTLPGCDYRPPGAVPRPAAALPPPTPMGEGWVEDLRGVVADSGGAAAAARLCAASGGRPGFVLVDEKTAGEAEILAAELQVRRCAAVVGRPTAGLAIEVARHPLPTGALLTVPVAPVKLSSGAPFLPTGVVPDRFVPMGATEDAWRAAMAKALGPGEP